MRFTYRIVREKSAFVAECRECEVAGEGLSEAAAVASLQTMLEERMFRPDAVAPPEKDVAAAPIELVHVPDSTGGRSVEGPVEGPGEAPPAPEHGLQARRQSIR